MNERLNALMTRLGDAIRQAFAPRRRTDFGSADAGASRARPARALSPASRRLLIAALAAAAGAALLVTHPPLQTVARGDVAVRTNLFSGSTTAFESGSVFVLPGLFELRSFPRRDQTYRPVRGRKASGEAPFQSNEGLSIGVDFAVRYALDAARIGVLAKTLPDDIGRDVVQPAVDGVVYKVFARYTVREIFSTQRAAIQQAIESELRTRLIADGIVLRSVQIGQIDLPAEYRQGMDRLLAEELASEKMKYTLELRTKQGKQIEIEALTDKARRETAASAQASEQIIAAQAQEEAMKHVLPFKQKQIEQRQLEAEAEKVSRIKTAEGSAQARRIEAAGEADSRQKLADAEAYRMDRVGKVASEQMAREGLQLTRHPLLIQKSVADKLSDKISVIIVPPGTDGRFIAAGLIGGAGQAAASTTAAADNDADGVHATATSSKEAP